MAPWPRSGPRRSSQSGKHALGEAPEVELLRAVTGSEGQNQIRIIMKGPVASVPPGRSIRNARQGMLSVGP